MYSRYQLSGPWVNKQEIELQSLVDFIKCREENAAI